MLSALYLRNSNNMPVEFFQDVVERNQANDWLSQLSAAVTRPCPPFNNTSSCSTAATENYLRRGLSLDRSLSTPEPRNWNESSLVASDDFRSSTDIRSPAKVGKSERYKTELCRSFEETGFCKYKEKCQFAHGFQELRNVQRHPKYKTDRCRTYHSTGFCPYGSRCHFIHDEQVTTTPPASAVGFGAPPEMSTRSSPVLMNDLLRTKVNDYEGPPAVIPDQMNQLLEALSRALIAVSSGSQSQVCSSPSPTLPSFELASVRQDSLTSGSLRSSPERLPTPTSVMRDDYGMSYSRISSCSNDYDVCGRASVQSPVSPTTPLYASMGRSGASAFSNIWARTEPHHFSTLFEV